MVRYEIKKIFGTLGSKIVLLLLAALVAYCAWTATHNWETKWVDENGEETSGYAASRKLRSARKEWAGALDAEHLAAVVGENQRILATPEYNSEIIQQRDIAYGWRQGIADIRDVFNGFFAETFNTYNYYQADSISPSALPGIYENRVRLLQEWLADETSEAAGRFTQAEAAWLVKQYEALETPMYYDYHEGWQQATDQALDLMFFCSALLGFLCAGIFSNEFKWKADSVYFSTQHGRNLAIEAKIWAGFLTVTVLYWAAILSYSLFVLVFLGFDGWNCPLQLDRWKSFYNLTMLERYGITILGGYLGNLFFTFLLMWISAKTRTALAAVVTPFVLYFLPNFLLQYVEGTVLAKVLALLPDRLLHISNAMNKFDLYSLGNWVVPAVPILFVLYSIATAALVPALYREFEKKELI